MDVGSADIVQERAPTLIVGNVPTGLKDRETTCKLPPCIVQERAPTLIVGSVPTGLKDLETNANSRRT